MFLKMGIERRKKEWTESVDPMKMYVPKEFGAEQDPPKMEKADMEQLPKLIPGEKKGKLPAER